MPNSATLADIKIELKSVIRSNSDRGFLPYGGCNTVCAVMLNMLDESSAQEDPKTAFDIHLYILIEIVKLISHADTSSGYVTDVVNECLAGINDCCKSVPAEDRKTLFNSIIKAAKNKAFDGWEEFAYRLLRSTVHLVQEEKQAQAIYDLFPILGTMYDDKEYPDRYVITQGIIERLEGAEAAERYRMAHLHVPEIRRTVVEEAIAAERYDLAEKLCLEAIAVDIRHWEPSQWAYCLERIYEKIGDTAKLIDIVEQIMMKGVRSYYPKLRALYDADGTWEQRKESILDKLSKAYMPHEYAALLAEVGEMARLLDVVKENQNLIEPYGKQLAREYPGETHRIYEAYILNEAAAATDRRKYKGVCKLIKSYYAAGAKTEARNMIQRLIEKYPRRVAMVDELETLDFKLKK